jgi:uncharacterized protein YxjI
MDLPVRYFVKQILEPLEIFTGIESKNRYEVQDESGRVLYYAYEESEWWQRQFLKNARKFTIKVVDNEKNVQFTVTHEIQIGSHSYFVYDSNGEEIGKIFTPWWSARRMVITSGNVELIARVSNQLKFNTFKIFEGECVVGSVVKRISAQDFVSRADNYDVECTHEKSELILAMVLALDVQRYEK